MVFLEIILLFGYQIEQFFIVFFVLNLLSEIIS